MNQEKIGKFIAELRKENNLTQEQLASTLEVSNRTISKWENGNCMPDYSILPTLCETLHITINELLSGEKLTEENYQKKLEENLILNMAELKKRTKKTFSLIFKIIGSLLIIFISLSLLEAVYNKYAYQKSYLKAEELNIRLCEKNNFIYITIEAKDNKPMLMKTKFDIKKMNYIYNPYHIRKQSYIENESSIYTYNFKSDSDNYSIVIANKTAYKSRTHLEQCQS